MLQYFKHTFTNMFINSAPAFDFSCSNVIADCHLTSPTAHIRLKHIRLVGNLTATDIGVAALAAHCPLLEHLDLPRCASISDDALKVIAVSCPRLRHLCLTWSSAATNAGVVAVAHGCPRLQHIELEGCVAMNMELALV